jgi:hypothetical protein
MKTMRTATSAMQMQTPREAAGREGAAGADIRYKLSSVRKLLPQTLQQITRKFGSVSWEMLELADTDCRCGGPLILGERGRMLLRNCRRVK